jgi:hypothetical protein
VFCETVIVLNKTLVSIPWDNFCLMKHPALLHKAVDFVPKLYTFFGKMLLNIIYVF